jgi:CDP-diacylglycerol---serine O-phosphatidyltransferase
MPVKHFSMIRDFHLADFFTIANGFCGVAALFQAMRFVAGGERGRLDVAAALVLVALIFDVLDGAFRSSAITASREWSISTMSPRSARPSSRAWPTRPRRRRC